MERGKVWWREKMRFIGENPGSEKSVPGFFILLIYSVLILENEAYLCKPIRPD